MSQQARPVLDISVIAVGAISYARAVALAATTVNGAIGGSQATVAGQKVFGVARRDALSGQYVDVTTLGTATCEAGAAIALGARVAVDASGRVVTATAMSLAVGTLTITAGATAVTSSAANGAGTISGAPTLSGGDAPQFVFGMAMQAASAAGDLIEVLICP